MSKQMPDITADAYLDYIAACDLMIACDAEPATYAAATGANKLADVAMAGGDFTKANDTSGRKVTMAAKSGVPIDTGGTATHIALCKSGDSTLRYITTCTSQVLTGGGTVDFPAWKINIADPT
jgi:hypothetical protein